MARTWGRRFMQSGSRRRRLAGCLLWLVGLLVLLIILSVLFGSFQLGTKAKSMSPPGRRPISVVPAPGPGIPAR